MKHSENRYFFHGEPDVFDARLSDYSQQYTVENPFDAQPIRPRVGKKTTEKMRLFFPIIVLFVGFFILWGRLFFLQGFSGDHYLVAAEGNRVRVETVKASRGVIFDRRQNLLVKNIPSFRIDVIPGDLLQAEGARQRLKQLLKQYLPPDRDVNVDAFLESLPGYSFQAITLVEDIPQDTAILLTIKAQEIPGVRVVASARRQYLGNESLGHILGYTGKISQAEVEDPAYADYLLTDYVGKTGLEASYERVLKGVDGKKQIEVDSFGREKEVIAESESTGGKNLLLSLDQDLQTFIYEQVRAFFETSDATDAAVVVLDPRDGSILASLSFPTYDSNVFHQGTDSAKIEEIFQNPDNPLLFRPIQGTYPSGSTFKPVVAAAGLQEGVITPTTTVSSVGGIEIGQWVFPDWKPGGHGQTNVTKALAESVNTFFYIVGGGYNGDDGLGVERLTEYAKKFGFGEKSGIDLPSEVSGFLPTKQWKEDTYGERWYIGDTYHYAIGQGQILVTPLQLANSIATIINGGKLYQPRFVKEFLNPDGSVSSTPDPVIRREGFIDPQHLNTVKDGMRQAVLAGSARSLQELPVSSGGKTGTAQFGSGGKTHSWFVGFAPYENPEVVIAVLVEGAGGGNDAALPIARETLQWYFTR
ncbi:MAG: penicillin-binding protein 2 [Candidatus Kerfeldbacteria bacterium RIFCSPHIGHO2_12_FULL_48_17]|uniref:Penicillin-binding protein 2 n=1 Tax=Candidatus Kerfeldbacteria bacterium RIFCSPHIGHO2_12_FULL_48_17 TaxID=1798542 RepID=A0A1G2AZ00_9BACT|nr:MAG: penicillin-binding protein 2 [Candidatus Kerfeldbacteria bacterium RIFCSPHIGHO2_12_FULL_48_17]